MSRLVAAIEKISSTVTIGAVGDLANAGRLVGLPVGPRGLRTKKKQEWYVLLTFLQRIDPARIFELPADIRCGNADAPSPEPDFVVSRGARMTLPRSSK
jgi:hypothetical protein